MSEQGPAPEEDVQWRRVHVITPVLNAWKVIVAIFVVLVYQNIDLLAEVWGSDVDWFLVLLIGGGGFVLLLLLLTGYSVLSWRMMRYAVGRDAVFLHSGILFRQQRHARLNRIQAVDVVQPLVARLFGLAKLKIETAGGAGSSVELAFLKEDLAQAVRREVLARAAGTWQDTPTADDGAPPASPAAPGQQPTQAGPAVAGTAPGTVPAPDRGAAPALLDSPERELLTVPPGRLVLSLLLSGSMITFAVVITTLVVVSIIVRNPAPMIGGLPAVIGWGATLWSQFSTGFGFRAAISADGVRLRHGLLEQRTQTVPPGRVHAVALQQPLLWRRRNWWRVRVNIAGYGETTETNSGTVLLPVGPRGDALTALWLVLPDLGVRDPQAVLDGALEGIGEDGGFTTSPRRARWLDPIAWRRNGILLTERATLIRRGRIFRSLTIVPHERSQSLALGQGPIQRRARLASITVAIVAGPVSARALHLDEMTALARLDEQSTLSRTQRDKESPEEWLRRVGLEPMDDGGAPAASPTPPPSTSVPSPTAPVPPPPSTGPVPGPPPPSGPPIVPAGQVPPPPSGPPAVPAREVPPPPAGPPGPQPPVPPTGGSAG